MSRSEAAKHGLELPKMDALEGAVRRALRQLEVWRERAVASESERRRLQAELDELKGSPDGKAGAGDLRVELEALRAENGELRRRLAKGRRQAEQLVREVEFLEDTR